MRMLPRQKDAGSKPYCWLRSSWRRPRLTWRRVVSCSTISGCYRGLWDVIHTTRKLQLQYTPYGGNAVTRGLIAERFNAGTHRDAIRMRYDDFLCLAKPRVCSFVQKG
jgi:hypothetical protein